MLLVDVDGRWWVDDVDIDDDGDMDVGMLGCGWRMLTLMWMAMLMIRWLM